MTLYMHALGTVIREISLLKNFRFMRSDENIVTQKFPTQKFMNEINVKYGMKSCEWARERSYRDYANRTYM